MKVTIKLFAQFRKNRFKEVEQELALDTTVADVLASLTINQSELGVALINGRHVLPEDVLHEGDGLSLFPKVGGG
jgi:sulfur carrier protein ThiS